MKKLMCQPIVIAVFAGFGALAATGEQASAYLNAPADSAAAPQVRLDVRDGVAHRAETGSTAPVSAALNGVAVENSVKRTHGKLVGLGGGPMPGMTALDVSPFRELIRRDPLLRRQTFSTLGTARYQAFFATGGMGYLSFGNGVRLGGGGMSCERRFLSDRFAADSALSLSIRAEYGGFMVEKNFRQNEYSFFTGMQIGGGSIQVSYCGVEDNAFSIDADEANRLRRSTASFTLFEVHGGITYTLMRFVHIGTDVSVPLFYAASGFSAITPEFVTVNPTFGVRLMVGTRE
jgi:hypothetical protein